MDPGIFPPSTIGWAAIATGAAGLIGFTSAILYASFGRIFGNLNDASTGIAGVASATMAMLLYPEYRLTDPQMGIITLSLAVTGGSIAAFGSLLSMFGVTSWFLAGLYIALGNALMGIWVMLISHAGLGSIVLPNALVSTGLFAGSVMALGFTALPGILTGRDSERSAPWISRYVGRAGDLGSRLLFPIWCIWLGHHLLSL